MRAWQRLFNADPQIVGKSITLNGTAFAVAGVLRPDFRLDHEVMETVASNQRFDIYVPLPLGPDAVNRRGDENYNIVARLKPGVTVRQAQADIDVIAARIREKDKRDRSFHDQRRAAARPGSGKRAAAPFWCCSGPSPWCC